LSAKKHSEKVSKYSALLYASSAHTSFPHPSFRDSVYWHKAGFLSRVETLGLWQAVLYWMLRSMFRLFA
ncbi:MAG: hypothetical protein E6357_25305, partial [Clostridiales bacterium]|nr:hypothetical protein [Clostridiales bacterium]